MGLVLWIIGQIDKKNCNVFINNKLSTPCDYSGLHNNNNKKVKIVVTGAKIPSTELTLH